MRAMLLAAGRGERMRPLTDHKPKPLLEAGGKPLIVWLIEKLVRAGIVELVINHAHLGALIEAELGDGGKFGARIQYSHEVCALETAGGIANALPFLLPSPAGRGAGSEGEPFAVINSDIYCDYDFARLPEQAKTFESCGDLAHLVLVDNPEHHPKGDFCLEGSRIAPSETLHPPRNPQAEINYPQSAIRNPQSSALTFSGIGVYHPSLFSHIQRGSIAALAPLLREQIAQGQVSGEHHRGLWVDVGTPLRLAELDRQIRSQHNTP